MKWWEGLSIRAANALNSYYNTSYPRRWDHYRIEPIDLSTLSITEVKAIIQEDVTSGKLNLLRVRNCGRKTAKEIYQWAEVIDNPLYRKPIKELVRMIETLQKEKNDQASMEPRTSKTTS